MFTPETLTAEVKELREQFQQAQQQLLLAKQQTEDLQATVERLQGAIIVSEKYLAQMQPSAAAPTPNGQSAVLATQEESKTMNIERR